MKFFSVLCFVSVLSFTSASKESKAKAEVLSDKITSKVVGELILVIHASKGTKISEAELNKKLLDTVRSAFKRMEQEIKELGSLSGESPDRVAKKLAHKINSNTGLLSALKEGKITPRAISNLPMIYKLPDAVFGREGEIAPRAISQLPWIYEYDVVPVTPEK